MPGTTKVFFASSPFRAISKGISLRLEMKAEIEAEKFIFGNFRPIRNEENLGGLIPFFDLNIQGPVIVNDAHQKESAGQKINDPGEPFSEIKSVDTE